MADECKPVGSEISTDSKQRAVEKTEDIVRAISDN